MFLHLANVHTEAVVTGRELPKKRNGRHQLSWDVHDLGDFKMGYGGAILIVTDSGPDRSREVLAVSRSYLHRRGADRTYQPLEAYDWSQVQSLPWSAVLAEMRPDLARQVDGELDRSRSENAPRDLPNVVAAYLQNALKELSPEIVDLLKVKGDMEAQPGARNESAAVVADQFATALRFSGADYRNAFPVEPTAEVPAEAQRLGEMWERDMGTTDAALMPGWDLGRRIAGWFEFKGSGDRRVLIKNVDTQPAETDTGGDLIYLRSDPDLAIVVQYKRLKRANRNRSWLFYNDHRLLRQLADLVALDHEPVPDSSDGEPLVTTTEPQLEQRQSRLGYEAGFVKFVDTAPLAGDGLSLLPGCYLPAQYAQERLAVTGEGGRFPPFNPRAGRHIDTNVFIALVSGGWIGAGAAVRTRLANEYLPRRVDEATGAVTMAFDLPREGSASSSSGRRGERAVRPEREVPGVTDALF